jgi:type II secretory pathway pseudopilin PulG
LKRAFTLVELLLSLVIATLIVGLVLSIYRTTAGAVQGQKNRARGGPAAARALEQIRDDLTSAMFPAEDGSCACALATTNGSSVFSFCSLLPVEGEADPKWSRAFHVEYGLDPGANLVRVVQPAAGPGSTDGAVTNVLVENIDLLKIAVFDGTEWQEEWPGENAQAKPGLVRVEIASARFKGKTSWQTEVFVPAGNVVTSSIARSVAP